MQLVVATSLTSLKLQLQLHEEPYKRSNTLHTEYDNDHTRANIMVICENYG